jgi:hypothetical protein
MPSSIIFLPRLNLSPRESSRAFLQNANKFRYPLPHQVAPSNRQPLAQRKPEAPKAATSLTYIFANAPASQPGLFV